MSQVWEQRRFKQEGGFNKRAGHPRRRQKIQQAAVKTAIESLESRVHLSAGGGFIGAGITGSYYNNATLSGSPAFTRADDRVDFNFGSTAAPGGSPDPSYSGLGTSNWSAKWVGEFIPKFSESYLFSVTSEGAARMYVAPYNQSFGSPQINNFTEHTSQAVNTASISLTAGQLYNIELDYETTSTPSEIKLQWSSTSTPTEDIEPAEAIGINVDGGDALFANMVNGGTRNYWWAPGNTNQTIATDSNFWPTADAELFLGEGDTTLDSGGTYLIQFKGTATLGFQNFSAAFHVGSTNYGSTLPDGDGYNSSTGLTTATMVVSPGNYNGFILEFTNTSREDNISNPQHDGITNLYVMQPTTLGGSTDATPGTLFTSTALSQLSQYTALRDMGLTDTNGSIVSNWSDRTIPSNEIWTGWSINGGVNGVSAGTTGSYGTGVPWEIAIALANETGKDIYINVPSNASLTYITDLADLFAYGSNGTNPYTSAQTNPVWAPLNSNLKVYIEFSNEIWNFGFTQAGTSGNGWLNQLSQRAVYDYETGNQNDSLYPGGGANAYNDGAIVAPLYITNSNKAAWLATYNASGAYPGYGSPQYFSNNDSALEGDNIYQGWVALRLEQISTAFKSVFSETSINADSNSSRVRPLFEWQYGGAWDGELSALQTLYGSAHRVGYYLYGGGAGWYADDSYAGFSDSTFANGNFATSPGVSGYQQNPSGTSWTYTGSAGIAANGSSLGNPTAPTLGPANNPTGSGQTAYLLPGASISQSVNFSGGYADITLLACQTIAANYGNDYFGMTISVDGTSIAESEGALLYSGNTSWAWDRTAAFNVSAGNHTITFKSTWNSGGGTVFFDNVGIQTVNGIFNQTASLGAPLPGSNGTGVSSVVSDVQICQQYGLFDVGYEGGFDVNENLGDDDINGYSDMGARGYSSATPNVGVEASLDARTLALAEATINEFYSYGGTLPIVFEQSGNINSWAVAAPNYFGITTPKQQAVDAIEKTLPIAPAFPATFVPNTLLPGNQNQNFNGTNGVLTSGSWIDWNIIVPETATYTFNAATTSGGSYRLSINDINTLGTGTSGGTINPTMSLTPGDYTFKVEDTAGSFNVSQVVISVAGAPSAPTLTSAVDGNQTASLTWGTVSGAAGYEVAYGTATGDYTTTINVGTATSYTVSGLTNNTTYFLAVYAYNSSGWSLPSTEAAVIPLANNEVGTLAAWNFANTNVQANNVAETQGASQVTATVLSQGPGLTTTGYTGTGSFGYYPSGNNYATTLSAAIADGQYVTFTVAPVSGRTFSLQTLTFDPYFQFTSGSGAGISYSTNGGSTFSSGIAATGTPANSGTPFTVNLSSQSALQNTSNSVIIHISLFGNGAYGFAGIGKAAGNDLVVTGSFSAPAGYSGPLGQFNFNGTAGTETTEAAAFQATNTVVGAVSRGSGYVANNQGYPQTFGNSICSTPTNNSYASSLSQAQSLNQYYQFTVAAASGHTLSLSTLGFSAWEQNANSNFSAGVAYSTDGVNFTTATLTGSVANATPSAPAPVTANLSGIPALQSTTATVTIRIYLYGAGAYEDTGLGRTESSNDLYINGSLV